MNLTLDPTTLAPSKLRVVGPPYTTEDETRVIAALEEILPHLQVADLEKLAKKVAANPTIVKKGLAFI